MSGSWNVIGQVLGSLAGADPKRTIAILYSGHCSPYRYNDAN